MASRLLVGVLAVAAVLVAAAEPAAADPAQPTNYESRVLSVRPAAPALEVKVVGGDGFLSAHVGRGHTLEVLGYHEEPYVRVLPDGEVQENRNSPATYLNANRYGRGVRVPPTASKDAVPSWKKVGSDGTYVWHDHRIHYMAPEIPPHLVPGTNRVQLSERPDGRWTVPLVVDGQRVVVTGELVLHDAPNPAPYFGLAVLLLLAVVLSGRFGPSLPVGLAAVGLAGVAAGVVGWEEHLVVPAAAGFNPASLALPAGAVAAAVLGTFLRTAATRAIVAIAGALAVVGWAVLRIESLWKAQPLSALPAALAQALTAGALGLAVGGLAVAVTSGALQARPRTLPATGAGRTAGPEAPDDEASQG